MSQELQLITAVSTITKTDPSLITSEASIESLVMSDSLDLTTAMDLQAGLESDGVTSFTVAGVQLPSAQDQVLFNTVFSLSTPDEQAAFERLMGQLNNAFDAGFKKHRTTIEKAVSNVVEISGSDCASAVALANTMKNDQQVLVKLR